MLFKKSCSPALLISLFSILFSFHAFAQDNLVSNGDGGMSGGGGTTIKPDPITVKDVHSIIRESRAELYTFLKRAHLCDGHADHNHFSTFAPVRDAFQKMCPLIHDIGITEETLKPCYDSNKVAKDGSIYGNFENGKQNICISSFRLSAKLSQENVHDQVIGLIAHEYTHLATASNLEKIPIATQHQIANAFMRIPRDEFATGIRTVWGAYEEMKSYRELIKENNVQLGSGRMARWLGPIHDNVYKIYYDLFLPYALHFEYVDMNNNLDMMAALARSNILTKTADYLEVGTTPKEVDLYRDLFGGSASINLNTALKNIVRLGSSAIPVPLQTLNPSANQYSFKEITTTEEVTAQLDLIFSTVGDCLQKMNEDLNKMESATN